MNLIHNGSMVNYAFDSIQTTLHLLFGFVHIESIPTKGWQRHGLMITLGSWGFKAVKNVPSGGTTLDVFQTLDVFHAHNEKYLQAQNSGGTF